MLDSLPDAALPYPAYKTDQQTSPKLIQKKKPAPGWLK